MEAHRDHRPSKTAAMAMLSDLWDVYVESPESGLTPGAIEQVRKPLIRLARGYE